MRDNSDMSYDAAALIAPAVGVPAATPSRIIGIAGRLVGAGLLLGMAWIHWRLYNMGFSSVAMIGPAFYANAVLGVLAAAAVLVSPSRWLALTAGAGALLVAGTLLALMLSLTVGLFGYHETSDAPYVPVTIAVELVGALVLAWLAWLHRGPLAERLRALAGRRGR